MPRVDNTRFYNISIKRFKQSAKGVQWQSKETQELRFEVFRKLLYPKIKEYTVVDAGCGFGDLYSYLHQENALPKQYIGIDVHAKMVKIAQKRTKQTILQRNILKEPLPEADYYLCSGGMNILERFETMLFITQMIKHARIGVIFNLLKGSDLSATYNKYLPREIQDAFKDFDGTVEIIEGYLDHDFTVHLKKAEPE